VGAALTVLFGGFRSGQWKDLKHSRAPTPGKSAGEAELGAIADGMRQAGAGVIEINSDWEVPAAARPPKKHTRNQTRTLNRAPAIASQTRPH
jgi:hypothetical protein